MRFRLEDASIRVCIDKVVTAILALGVYDKLLVFRPLNLPHGSLSYMFEHNGKDNLSVYLGMSIKIKKTPSGHSSYNPI